MKFRLSLCVLLLCSSDAWGQQKNVPPAAKHAGPTIGVAFEGGGALGYAHIGVLKWFEEKRIPVDYVSGTSMGALVGGMYAMGRSPQEIKDAIRSLDPAHLLYGETEYADLSLGVKAERRAYLNSLQIGLSGGFELPTGLNAGQKVNFVLDAAALPYSYVSSFDQLPIPFRCVATNLITGKERVFSDGPLAEALRSSMSIPGVFTPVRTQERSLENGTSTEAIYVDGGLVNNLPVKILQQMGAQVIIAVHMKKKELQPSDIKSVLDVLEKSLDAMILANEERSLALLDKTRVDNPDIEIEVDVSGFRSVDFGKLDDIAKQGYDAAQGTGAALLRLQLPPDEWTRYTNERKSKVLTALPRPPAAVTVAGDVTQSEALAKEFHKQLDKLAGAAFSEEELRHDLKVLNREKRFTRIEYHMIPDDKLLVSTQETGYRLKRVRLGFEMNGTQPDEVQYSLGGGATFLDLGRLNSALRVDFALGSVYRTGAEYFHPITPESHWFLAPRAEFASTPLNLYSHNAFLAGYRSYSAAGAIDFGYRFSNWLEARAGYELGHLRDSLRIGSALLPQVTGRTGATSVRLLVDRVDDPVVPRQGVAASAAFSWIDAAPGAVGGFPLAEARFGVYHRVPERITPNGSVFFTAAGGTTFGHAATGLPQFFLGGPERFAAYGANELRTNQYFLFRAGYTHKLFELSPFLGKGVFLTSAYEIGKVYGAPSASRLPNDFAAGVVMETILGPAFVGASIGDTGHHKWFFQLGHVF